MKRLLMATDLSARSDRALQRAATLAGALGAKLDVVTVVDDSLPRPVRDRHEEAARTAIDLQIRALPGAHDAIASVQILSGEDFIAILGYAESIKADLIVLGIHRHSTRMLFRGTTAERVIRFGRLPVLVVRDPVAQPYRRVLVGADLSLHSKRALELAVKIAPDAEFRLVHAADVPFKSLLNEETVLEITETERLRVAELLDQSLREFASPVSQVAQYWEIVAEEGLPQDVIRRQSEAFRPDLIALGTHGRSGIANAVLGSVAEELLSDAPTDVLAAKAW